MRRALLLRKAIVVSWARIDNVDLNKPKKISPLPKLHGTKFIESCDINVTPLIGEASVLAPTSNSTNWE